MFNNIHKEIEKTINERKVTPVSNPQVSGVMISLPGTERIVMSTTVADFMTCEAQGAGKTKTRYCVVHKTQDLKFNGQYCDSNGKPLSIVTKDVFDVVVSILSSTNKKIQELKRDLDRAIIDKESYKMTLDALRKNGVID